jgi:hypothetical protein
MATFEELDALSSKELHDRAVHVAERHLDVKFFFELLEAIPAANAAEGEADVMSMRALLNDLLHADEGELADSLRPIYIDYLIKHS